ncbi:MAG: hypothetical protein A2233_01415 [Candidatus Kerfeldbacteria bacterium RIFOXYA2_FULL_38_24]|uniref:UPF0102 protein A2319_05505 n=1 Tax=Candidatus Kerfeldbacteria bacterium RIFOXYB2_FULL_38_14 TaxID=1798547 RepID=A0A1G2BDR3_9BACT|nr:MAG: hypothetical protein A2233_01415 [Candidatus Kerfeldbacteria bacterium RIFOXYA2_FULL_38_24]OGY87393.1 MAG: hypothetical protein A2319_05505 [Candidatus Kerfeldbacteria bacterium RIFOXYB2_FULL_38_14]OGY90344.1 MAG: hypothetical protein A2458_04410 [Candidatus Kerfeldbacteria bacterium RIFOXYC2_FULL_38_9]
MNKTHNQNIGKKGEDLAAQYLQDHGFKILGQNINTRYGELDILARQKLIIHVVEVKTRTSDLFGMATEAINIKKLSKMKKTQQVLKDQGVIPVHAKVQYDFIAITIRLNAFTLEPFWNIGELDLPR